MDVFIAAYHTSRRAVHQVDSFTPAPFSVASDAATEAEESFLSQHWSRLSYRRRWVNIVGSHTVAQADGPEQGKTAIEILREMVADAQVEVEAEANRVSGNCKNNSNRSSEDAYVHHG